MNYQETIAQIGKVTLMSVGAHEFVSTPDSLRFKVGRGDRKVTITLDASDTYTVETVLIRPSASDYRHSSTPQTGYAARRCVTA